MIYGIRLALVDETGDSINQSVDMICLVKEQRIVAQQYQQVEIVIFVDSLVVSHVDYAIIID